MPRGAALKACHVQEIAIFKGAIMDLVNEIVDYVGNSLQSVFMSGGYIPVIVAVVVALLFGLLVSEYKVGTVASRTVQALFVYALALAVINFVQDTSQGFEPWLRSSTDAFLQIQLGEILTAFVAFFIVISLAHFLVGMVNKK